MIRTLKHKEKDYIVVDTTFQVKDGEKIVSVPFHLQLNATGLDEEDHAKILKKANALFNHVILVNLKKPERVESSIPWYKRILK